MLILLGMRSVAGILRWLTGTVKPVHVNPHRHGDSVHGHAHGETSAAHGYASQNTPLARLDLRLGDLGLYQVLRPLLVGVVHGLAGAAAVALLVLATIPDPLWGIAYLVVFGAGTIAGMMLVTAASALPFAYTVN